MEILRKVWNSLDPSLQQNQQLLLCKLEIILREAVELINAAIDGKHTVTSLSSLLRAKGKIRKGRFAIPIKRSLDDTVNQFKEWHLLFDPFWYLIARVPDEEIDQHLRAKTGSETTSIQGLIALRKSIRDLNAPLRQPVRQISSYDFLGPRKPISGSSAAIAQFHDRNGYAIVDSMLPGPLADRAATSAGVAALCKALSRMDPNKFGLFRCCGVINKSETSSDQGPLEYELIFDVPHNLSEPTSLRNLLKGGPVSVNLRLDISRKLATSVFFLHTTGFVHKNIRPENILIFKQKASSETTCCLVGFENFRLADGGTFLTGDDIQERNMYRHPSRQGNDPEMEYVMQHDIYSLGICLLEIGLWKPFVQQSQSEGAFIPHPDLGLDQYLGLGDTRMKAFSIKKRLIGVAEGELPSHFGDKMTQIVLTCLSCLDDPAIWNTSEYEGSEDINVGVNFIESVLLGLQEIVV